MKSRILFVSRLSLPFATALAALLSASSAHATDYYWDIDGVTAGAGGAVATGIWATGGTTWSTSTNGTLATSAVTTALTDDLFFSAGINATGNTVITVDTAENAKSLTVQDGNLFIGGTGSVTLGGTGIINVPNNLTATAVNSATLGNTGPLTIAGSAGVTKTGVGTLVFNGSAVNTFTGGLNVNGGTLELRSANLTTPTDLINSGNALALGGGNLSVISNATGTTSQTFNNVTVNSGGGGVLVNPNGGTDTNITLGSITSTASGGSFVVGRSTSSGTGTLSITTTTNKDALGIYGGRVISADGTADTGYDWATTVTASPGPYVFSSYTGYSALDTTTAGDISDTNNSRITATATLPSASNRTTNSLKFENPAAGGTFNILAGNTLTLTSGGLLMTGANANININNGSITAGDGTAPADLVVHQFNPAQLLTVGLTGGSLGNTPEILSNIVNNNGQPVTLVKNGPGSLRITGTNTFTGGVIVNQGSVDFGNLSLNNNPITFNANAFLYTNGVHITSGGITLNNGSQVTVCNNNSSFTVNANVVGSGGLSAANGGQGAMTLTLNGTANTFTGPVRFTHSNGTQQCSINVASLPDTDTFGTGNITFGAGTLSSTSQNFSLASTAIAPLTLTNRRFEMAVANVNQQINNASTQALTINSDLLVTGSQAKNLQLGGAGAGISTFAGVIANHPSPTAPGTVPNALRKSSGASNNTLTLASVEGISVGATITGAALTAGTTITAINFLTREVTLSTTFAAANNSTYNVGVLFTVPGVVNSVSVTKADAGTWVLSGNSSYTGPTNITAGKLNIQHANALGSTTTGTLVASNATLQLQSGISFASEALTLTNNTTNTAILQSVSGNNTWNGTITTTGNTASSFARIQADADTLTLAGTIDSSTNGSTSVVLQGASAITVTGQVTGSGGLISGSANAGPGSIRTVSNDTNNFTGRAQVSGGVLAFTSVANSGTASALGAGTVTPTIGLSSGTSNGTLRYIGTDPLGHTTTRDINLGSGTAGDHTATIEANGTGTLGLGPVSSTTSGSKTLLLTGTNAGSNSIGAITPGSATAVSLTKSGAGKWVLSDVNTYTGATTVNGGILALGASGSIGNSASVALGAAGTLDTSLQTTYTISAAQPVTISIDPTGAGSSGKITAASLDITNAVVTLSPTATLDDAVYVIATYSGTLSGSTSASITGLPSGYTLDPAYQGNKIALIKSASNNYASWANDPLKGNIPGELPADDFDKDGIANIIEYALGMDPRVSTVPAGVLTDNTITYTKGADAIANGDVKWIIETSETLLAASWTDEVTQNAGDATPTISYTFTPGTPLKKFARLKVEQLP